MTSLFKRKQLREPSDAIDQIVTIYIAPLLKKEGFKKTGRTWLREFDDYSLVINVQARRWNSTGTSAEFTLNYGIYIPSTYEQLFGMQKPKSPKEYDCLIRKRVVGDDGRELWLDVYDYDDTEILGQEVESKITDQCLRMFNEVKSLVNIADMMRPDLSTGTPWSLLASALLNAELGNIKEAEDCFRGAYRASNGNPPFQSKVISASKKYAIIV